MRYLAWTALLTCMLLQGCRHSPQAGQNTRSAPAKERVVPLTGPAGKVVLLNEKLRYVVLDFSSSRVPAEGQRLSVYHAGQKMGELKVTGAPMNQTITADIMNGQAAVGDDARPD